MNACLNLDRPKHLGDHNAAWFSRFNEWSARLVAIRYNLTVSGNEIPSCLSVQRPVVLCRHDDSVG